MSKVYCKNCRHLRHTDYGIGCVKIDKTRGDWYSNSDIVYNPRLKNKNNDCEHWQKKRTFMEWIYFYLPMINKRVNK